MKSILIGDWGFFRVPKIYRNQVRVNLPDAVHIYIKSTSSHSMVQSHGLGTSILGTSILGTSNFGTSRLGTSKLGTSKIGEMNPIVDFGLCMLQMIGSMGSILFFEKRVA